MTWYEEKLKEYRKKYKNYNVHLLFSKEIGSKSVYGWYDIRIKDFKKISSKKYWVNINMSAFRKYEQTNRGYYNFIFFKK